MSGKAVRGEVWIVRIDKHRPAVVVSADAFGRAPKLLVVPLTAQLHRGELPATVRLAKNSVGLSKASVAQAAEVQPVRRTDLVERRGRLSPELLEELDGALGVALGLTSGRPDER